MTIDESCSGEKFIFGKLQYHTKPLIFRQNFDMLRLKSTVKDLLINEYKLRYLVEIAINHKKISRIINDICIHGFD